MIAELDGVVSRLWRIDDPDGIAAALGGVDGPAADRRRPPSLRDRAALPRGGGHGGDGLRTRRARRHGRLRARDLPDAPGDRRRGPRAGRRARADAARRSRARRSAALAGDRPRPPAFVLLSPDGARSWKGRRATPSTPRWWTRSRSRKRWSYTPSAAEAERAVSSGEATAAFLVRAPDGASRSRSSPAPAMRMPPKSTYFFPKLTSGLLFSPSTNDVTDWLQVCRDAARAVAGRARGAADAARARADASATARAATRRRRSMPRRRRPSCAGSRPSRPGFTLVSRRSSESASSATEATALTRRLRPDRRQPERQARHPVLLAFARGRLRPRAWRTSSSASSTTSAPARSGWPARGEGAFLNGSRWTGRARRSGSRSSRSRRRAPISSPSTSAAMVGFAVSHARHGLARALALPPRRRPHRRRRLAQAGAERGHRRGAAARPRARARRSTFPRTRPSARRRSTSPRRSRVVAAATPELCAELHARLPVGCYLEAAARGSRARRATRRP